MYIDLIYKAVKDLVITKLYQRLEKAIVWRKLSPYSTYRRPQSAHVSLIIHIEQFRLPPISQSRKRKKEQREKVKKHHPSLLRTTEQNDFQF